MNAYILHAALMFATTASMVRATFNPHGVPHVEAKPKELRGVLETKSQKSVKGPTAKAEASPSSIMVPLCDSDCDSDDVSCCCFTRLDEQDRCDPVTAMLLQRDDTTGTSDRRRGYGSLGTPKPKTALQLKGAKK